MAIFRCRVRFRAIQKQGRSTNCLRTFVTIPLGWSFVAFGRAARCCFIYGLSMPLSLLQTKSRMCSERNCSRSSHPLFRCFWKHQLALFRRRGRNQENAFLWFRFVPRVPSFPSISFDLAGTSSLSPIGTRALLPTVRFPALFRIHIPPDAATSARDSLPHRRILPGRRGQKWTAWIVRKGGEPRTAWPMGRPFSYSFASRRRIRPLEGECTIQVHK